MRATTEEAFEALIEHHLLEHGGYLRRSPRDFDPELALIPADLLGYVEDTQPKIWAKQRAIHGTALEANLLSAFGKAAKQQGVLHVLRHGFKFYGSTILLATFRPAHGLNPEVERLYGLNRVAVARQVRFDPKAPGLELDLVLFVNGVPVVTVELKNALSGTSAPDAMRQYKTDRDPKAPIFRFKERALVHFAVGSDEAWMTTRLQGGATYFLPFNRGRDHGAGNPAVEGKHRTWYLWEEVWQRDSLLEILSRFLHLQRKEKLRPDGSNEVRETLIFPRYHQLECVRKLVAAARQNGAGTNYLVQHSAGSGKSNSIAWLAHRLASLHDADDRKLYDGVVVITDRRVLDQQLQDTIYQIDHKQGVVRRIKDGQMKSAQLADALREGAPIIICTLHSFGWVADKIESLVDRRYAIVVDEAHSSQSGDMAAAMKEVLGASSIAERYEEEVDDTSVPDQAALRAALARGPQRNLSYFAFTATPKFKTLELFGHRGPDGKPAPFHLYSMRQAIEEGFIHDVLANYVTYETYFRIDKAITDDPELDKSRASAAIARFVSLHEQNLAQRADVIVNHFRAHVVSKVGGQAKAMVVTASRLHALRYKRALDKYCREHGIGDVGVLVAFSGSLEDDGEEWTEAKVNGFPDSETPARFDSDDWQILVVAEKYQTGFDQPKLYAMYVDKTLTGLAAVQTLSRLNRTHPAKTGTFVLDFRNTHEQIQESFEPWSCAPTPHRPTPTCSTTPTPSSARSTCCALTRSKRWSVCCWRILRRTTSASTS
ncbi:MAG: DEAD/DEAH box helicase family protein [Acidobacteriota bacterium]